ncbi:unnamed protein product [Echinostoma caproni]|uniref:C-type lectin domain-containing protein n=1 Tax=Echinostoma caproni TaxID=27848 RepID=A0A183AJH8_9TREM|nr:unnamed protein product [Echinostoma caproni]
MIRLGFIFNLWCLSLTVVRAWSPAAAWFAASSRFLANPFTFNSPWFVDPPRIPVRDMPYRYHHHHHHHQTEDDEDEHAKSEIKIRRLISVAYDGRNYVMVENLTLPFEQAEQYCETEFSDPMHLISVHSDAEWEMLNDAFGQTYPSGIWLGGKIRHLKPKVFALMWNDHTPVDYHRFSVTEQERWVSNWNVRSHGCIVASVERSKRGNWTTEFAPCVEPRAFICKEPGESSSSRRAHFHMVNRHFTTSHRDSNTFDDRLDPSLLPPRPGMPSRFGPAERQRFRFEVVQNQNEQQRHAESEENAKRKIPSYSSPPPLPAEEMQVTESEVITADTSETTTTTTTSAAKSESSSTPVPAMKSHPASPKLPSSTESEQIPVASGSEESRVPHQSSASGPAINIISTAPVLAGMPNQSQTPPAGPPKFTVVQPTTSHSAPTTSVVRMPILKSNAQVIYPQSIWDLV